MNPFIGLDVSKGKSRVQAFLDKGKPTVRAFKFHTLMRDLKFIQMGRILLFGMIYETISLHD